MKKKIVFFIIAIMMAYIFLLAFQFFAHPIPPRAKIAHKICREIASTLKEKYQLKWMGISEEGPEKYKCIGLMLNCPRILTKDEGRELLLNCADDALNIFNSHPEFEEHMNNVPFNYNNISIAIFIHPPENFDVYYPEISTFACVDNELWYKTKIPNQRGLYHTKEIETIEEAKQIMQETARTKGEDLNEYLRI